MNAPARRQGEAALAALLLAGLAVVLLLRAWVADDAYISYRVVANWLDGHGLRWNTDERVQVFTHPLWLLLHGPAAWLTGDIPRAGLWLSGASVAGTGLVLWRALGLTPLRFALVAALPLVAARCHADFSFSGLETPLTALVFALFAERALAHPERPAWGALALVTALAGVNRLDALLFPAPVWLLLLLRCRGRLPWGRVLLGALPLLAWLFFALVYYGFVFPNTAYAKLSTGIPAADLWLQGAAYLLDTAWRDPAATLILGAAFARAAGAARRALDPARACASDAMEAALGAGLALELLYVASIGGDFMRGRFVAPLLPAAVLLALRGAGAWSPRRVAAWCGSAVIAAAVATLLANAAGAPHSTGWRGIGDERSVFAEHTRFFFRAPDRGPEAHPWAQRGLAARQRAEARGRPEVLFTAVIGLTGFYAGPEVRVVDLHGLGDPVLARLPAADPARWRIGHFRRRRPPGYLPWREGRAARSMDPAMLAYADRIRLVVSGPLLAPERWREIWRFHSGQSPPPGERGDVPAP